MEPQLKYWRGYVKLRLTGDNKAAFIDFAAKKHLQLWDIRYTANEIVEFRILLHDFFHLKPLLRQTSCKIHVLKRYGAPFFLDKLGNRKFLIAGMLLFVIGLFLMSSIVWQVTVIGNDKLQKTQILDAAKQQGIYRLQWKFKLKDTASLAKELQRQLPATSWVGIRYHGTQLTIEVVESTEPEVKPLLSPRNLIASTNAIITQIKAEKGMPMVKSHAFVRKGDILISGVIGTVPNQQVVVAKGSVRGEVWYTSLIEVPLVLKQNSYTGESTKRLYLVLGNRALPITGFRQKKFVQSNKQIVRKTLQWNGWSLPIGWIKMSLQETQILEFKRSKDEAVLLGIKQAQASILQSIDAESRIIAQKILHERSENGKVYMEVHFEVEQSIVQDQPIIQGE